MVAMAVAPKESVCAERPLRVGGSTHAFLAEGALRSAPQEQERLGALALVKSIFFSWYKRVCTMQLP